MSRAEGVDSDDPNLQKLLNHYLERAIAHVESAGLTDERADYFHRLYNEAITAQRRLLIAMRESDQIDEDTFRILQNRAWKKARYRNEYLFFICARACPLSFENVHQMQKGRKFLIQCMFYFVPPPSK